MVGLKVDIDNFINILKEQIKSDYGKIESSVIKQNGGYDEEIKSDYDRIRCFSIFSISYSILEDYVGKTFIFPEGGCIL